MRDEMRGGGEDMAGRAIIALEANDFRAGEILFEAQDVVDLRAAPAIDRLVVVADAADVFGRAGSRASFVLRHLLVVQGPGLTGASTHR